jgi:hypothetical protein
MIWNQAELCSDPSSVTYWLCTLGKVTVFCMSLDFLLYEIGSIISIAIWS